MNKCDICFGIVVINKCKVNFISFITNQMCFRYSFPKLVREGHTNSHSSTIENYSDENMKGILIFREKANHFPPAVNKIHANVVEFIHA